MKAYDIEVIIANLTRIREVAIRANLGEHFIAEIDHLIATAEANK